MRRLAVMLILLSIFLPEIFSATISSCTVIDTPGYYELTTDLSVYSGTCIQIRTSNVILNLNGHTVGSGKTADYGQPSPIGFYSGGQENITIENGTIGTLGKYSYFGTDSYDKNITLRNVTLNDVQMYIQGYQFNLIDSYVKFTVPYSRDVKLYGKDGYVKNVVIEGYAYLDKEIPLYVRNSWTIRNLTVRNVGVTASDFSYATNLNIDGLYFENVSYPMRFSGTAWYSPETTALGSLSSYTVKNVYVNGQPIYFYTAAMGCENVTVPTDAAAVYVGGCNNITISSISTAPNVDSVIISNSTHVYINGLNITNFTRFGLIVWNSSFVRIANSNVSMGTGESSVGIYSRFSNLTVENVSISNVSAVDDDDGVGLVVESSQLNACSLNLSSVGDDGIYLRGVDGSLSSITIANVSSGWTYDYAMQIVYGNLSISRVWINGGTNGIGIEGKNNVSLSYITVTNVSNRGISISGGKPFLYYVNVENSLYGLYLYGGNVKVRRSNFFNNTYDIHFHYDSFSNYSLDNDFMLVNETPTNYVTSGPVYYYNGLRDVCENVDLDHFGLAVFVNCRNITVHNNAVSNLGRAIIFYNVTHGKIENFTAEKLKFSGIQIQHSQNILLKNISIYNVSKDMFSTYDKGVGLYLILSRNINATGLHFENIEDHGIRIYGSEEVSENLYFDGLTVYNFSIAFSLFRGVNDSVFKNFFLSNPKRQGTGILNSYPNYNNTFENINITAVANGISCEDVADKLINVTVYNSSYGGIRVWNSGRNNYFEDIRIYPGWQDGIEVFGNNNTFYNVSGKPICITYDAMMEIGGDYNNVTYIRFYQDSSHVTHVNLVIKGDYNSIRDAYLLAADSSNVRYNIEVEGSNNYLANVTAVGGNYSGKYNFYASGSNNIYENITAKDGFYGFVFYNALSSTLRNATIVNNQYDFGVAGDYPRNYDTHIVDYNSTFTTAGQILVLSPANTPALCNAGDISSPIYDNASYILVASCDNIKLHPNSIDYFHISQQRDGVLIVNSNNATVERFKGSRFNPIGVFIFLSNNSLVRNFTLNMSYDNNIYVNSGQNNTIENFTVGMTGHNYENIFVGAEAYNTTIANGEFRPDTSNIYIYYADHTTLENITAVENGVCIKTYGDVYTKVINFSCVSFNSRGAEFRTDTGLRIFNSNFDAYLGVLWLSANDFVLENISLKSNSSWYDTIDLYSSSNGLIKNLIANVKSGKYLFYLCHLNNITFDGLKSNAIRMDGCPTSTIIFKNALFFGGTSYGDFTFRGSNWTLDNVTVYASSGRFVSYATNVKIYGSRFNLTTIIDDDSDNVLIINTTFENTTLTFDAHNYWYNPDPIENVQFYNVTFAGPEGNVSINLLDSNFTCDASLSYGYPGLTPPSGYAYFHNKSLLMTFWKINTTYDWQLDSLEFLFSKADYSRYHMPSLQVWKNISASAWATVENQTLDLGANKVRIENISIADPYYTLFAYPDNPATVTLLSPTNNSVLTTSYANLSFYALDDFSPALSCTLILDTNYTWNGTAANNTDVTVTLANLTNGGHTWYVECSDTYGPSYSEIWTFIVNYTVDTAPPSVIVYNPVNGTTTNNLTLLFYAEDDTSVSMIYSIYLNGSPVVLGTVANATNESVWLNVTDGYYELWLNVSDAYNNTNESQHLFVTVDSTPPFVIVNSPSGVQTSTTIVFNFTVDDLTNTTYVIVLDGVNVTNGTAIPGEEVIYNISTTYGSHTYAIVVSDEAGNVAIYNGTVEIASVSTPSKPKEVPTKLSVAIICAERTLSVTYLTEEDDPIEDAVVRITGPVSVVKRTDSAGIAEFSGLFNGNYTVTVRKSGYEEQTEDVEFFCPLEKPTPTPSESKGEEEKALETVSVYATPYAKLGERVAVEVISDVTSKPVPDVVVEVIYTSGEATITMGRYTTDENGKITYVPTRPGYYTYDVLSYEESKVQLTLVVNETKPEEYNLTLNESMALNITVEKPVKICTGLQCIVINASGTYYLPSGVYIVKGKAKITQIKGEVASRLMRTILIFLLLLGIISGLLLFYKPREEWKILVATEDGTMMLRVLRNGRPFKGTVILFKDGEFYERISLRDGKAKLYLEPGIYEVVYKGKRIGKFEV